MSITRETVGILRNELPDLAKGLPFEFFIGEVVALEDDATSNIKKYTEKVDFGWRWKYKGDEYSGSSYFYIHDESNAISDGTEALLYLLIEAFKKTKAEIKARKA